MSNYNEHMTNEARLICDNEYSIYMQLREFSKSCKTENNSLDELNDLVWELKVNQIVFNTIPALDYVKGSDFDPGQVDVKSLAFDLYQYHVNEH